MMMVGVITIGLMVNVVAVVILWMFGIVAAMADVWPLATPTTLYGTIPLRCTADYTRQK